MYLVISLLHISKQLNIFVFMQSQKCLKSYYDTCIRVFHHHHHHHHHRCFSTVDTIAIYKLYLTDRSESLIQRCLVQNKGSDLFRGILPLLMSNKLIKGDKMIDLM